MSKPIIAIDIDDVLAVSAAEWVAFSNRRWGTHLTVEDYDEDWSKMWGVDRAEEKRRARKIHDQLLIRDFPPDAMALTVLKELQKRFKLVIATSRVQAAHKETLAWLERHYQGVFSDVHLTGFFDLITADSHTATKAELVRQISADYLIDDQPKHCWAVAEAGGQAVLFGDYAWNRNVGRLPQGVTRCADWAAVKEYFNGRS